MTVAVVAGLLARHTPGGDIAVYSLYLLLGVVAPGTLVHKALRGSQGSWLADLGLGAATGLVLGLFAWAGASLLDARGALWAWPLLTLLLLASRRARTRIRHRPQRPWPPGPTLAVAAAVVVVVAQQWLGYLAPNDLPPSDRGYYPDLLWHLGLAAEAARDLPLQTPQVADAGVLRYHWFSNAHVAASSLMTGIDVQTIMLRLWVVPVAVLFVVLTAVLAQRVSSKPWVGAAAAWVCLPTLTLPFWPSVVPNLAHLNAYSPSQLFAYPVLLLTLHALVDAVRSPTRRWGPLAVAGVGAVGCSGAKASALPVLLGGLGLALLAALVLRRNRLRLLLLCVAGAGLAGVALVLVSGGDSGAGIQLLSSLTLLLPYRVLLGREPAFDTLLPSGLVDSSAGALLLVTLVVATALGAMRTLALVAPFMQRRLRGDLAAWLLTGVCASSLVPFLLLGHEGYSQYYFVYSSIPAGSALLAWSAATAIEDAGLSRRVAICSVVAGAALTGALGAWAGSSPPAQTASEMQTAMVVFVGQLGVGLVALGTLTWVWVRRRRSTDDARKDGPPTAKSGRRAWASVAVAVALSALIGGLGTSAALTTARGELSTPGAADAGPVALGQSEAAVWVRANVPDDDLLAVNTHCLSGTGLRCDSRRWWLSGLSGRRVLLESWSYVPAAAHVGYYDAGLLALNQQAFSAPTPEVLTRLKTLGVGWLVAESVAGQTISPDLDDLAERRYANDHVTVWRLR